MLRKKLKKIIMIALMVSSLFLSVTNAKTINKPFKLNENSIVYVQKQEINKGRVLIYHSHTFEAYKDGVSIYDIGEDLTKKLEKKGFEVEHVNEDYSKDGYNLCYYSSRQMLLSKDLSQYKLIIDLHRNSGDKPAITQVYKNEVAECFFVGALQNPNRESALHIINSINNNLDSFSTNIHKATIEKSRKTNFYNAELSPNMVLLEIGNDQNTSKECFNTNTYLSESIANYINNSNVINKYILNK
jgi:stage II sporulation protein P